MTDQRFSIVIRGGTLVLPEGVAPVDIGIRDETLLRSGSILMRASQKLMQPAELLLLAASTRTPTSSKYQEQGSSTPTASKAQPHQRPLGGLRRSSRSPRNTLVSHSIALSPTITISLIGAP